MRPFLLDLKKYHNLVFSVFMWRIMISSSSSFYNHLPTGKYFISRQFVFASCYKFTRIEEFSRVLGQFRYVGVSLRKADQMAFLLFNAT